MRMVDLTAATWRKSSHSAQEGQCIEVSVDFRSFIPVRDSKDPQGPALVFPAAEFAAFLTALRAGEFGEI
ncbi:DUF397 domain-containing protein [Streptomyces sp. BE303]|uniref:DUF397 domain-containing protein n=1 Tax=Streptomyces sp. BE303 TaxID=3002528 RepID=UPI002E77E59B|nr:DUF397 domain-containing protein [Streptomyces sp. BE303]MED7953920.1 DUF397 domain-containing protein [Streptomyces sp. BE303]